MRLAARVHHWFRAVFRRADVERELADELQFHVERETEAHRHDGLPASEARAAALRNFGGVMQVQEECRDAWGVRVVDQLRQDLAYAWRGLGRNPGFAAAVLLTLAIGIGASTAMFSVVHAVLLRPLPYHEPGRLVAVWSEVPRRGVSQSSSAYANIEDWRKSSRTLRALTAYDPGTVILTDARGEARRASAVFTSASLFEALGVRPLLGRAFTKDESARGEALAILSHQAWQQRFASDPGVIGRPLIINNRPVEIIGVMPAGFYFPDKNDELWLPETLAKGWEDSRTKRGTHSWRVAARLADGVSLDEARTELAGIGTVLAQAYPEGNAGLGIRLVPLSLQVTGRQLRLALLVLVAAVTAVLLIACSNVANLLLARGAARQREFAVRESLGAGRGRLIGQLLAECTLLSLLAAVAGTALAWGALQGVRTFGPGNIPRLDEISLDPAALAFAVLLAFASAVISGLVPALRSVRRDPMIILRGGRSLSEGGKAQRWRSGLVAAEFALAIVLLIAASLLVRSFVRLTAVDTGFRTERVLVAGINFPSDRPEEQATAFAGRLLERVRALPGVVTAGISEEVLLNEVYEQSVSIEGLSTVDGSAHRLLMRTDTITPDYFRTVGVPLRFGRFFSEQDGPQSPSVVIVNEAFARRFWPGENPVGRRIREDGSDSGNPWSTVIGVVADIRRQGPEYVSVPQVFRPLTQRSTRPMNLVVATNLEPATLAPTVRAVIAEIDRSVPVTVSTLREQLDRKLAPREFNLGLIGVFAAMALTLAGIGIFGLMNYTVACRTQEIGIRVALGARPENILRMILSDGLKLALIGTALGVVASMLLMRGLAGLLYEISPLDPLSFLGAIVLLVTIALLASYLPARRALAVNPVTALRGD